MSDLGSSEIDRAKERVAEREREQKKNDQSLADWGFLWPTEIPGPGGAMFGFGAALFGEQPGHLNRIAACEDCGTLVGVPLVEDIESFDQAKAPVNLHIRYCPAITALKRKARFEERQAQRGDLFDDQA